MTHSCHSTHVACTFQVRPVQRRRQGCLCCIPSDRSCGHHTTASLSLACVLSEYTDRHSTCTCTVSALSLILRCTAQYNACLSESYSSCVRELAWSTVTHSFSHRVQTATIGTTPSIGRIRTSSWWSCPLLYSHCAWHPRPSLLVRFASFKVQSCRVTHRQLRCRMPSVPTQHGRTRNRSRTVPRQGTLSSRTSALMPCTQLPPHLESRTHHNLSHPLLRLELHVVCVESPTSRFSSRGPEDSRHTRRPRDTHFFLKWNGHDSHVP